MTPCLGFWVTFTRQRLGGEVLARSSVNVVGRVVEPTYRQAARRSVVGAIMRAICLIRDHVDHNNGHHLAQRACRPGGHRLPDSPTPDPGR
jgi:hypothetical protein